MATKGMTVFTQNGEDFTINDPNIANEFSAGTAYAVGDHVTYQGKLYVFTAAHSAGEWNAAHVTQVTVGGELIDLKSAIDSTMLMVWQKNDFTWRYKSALDPDTAGVVYDAQGLVSNSYNSPAPLYVKEGTLEIFAYTNGVYQGVWNGSSVAKSHYYFNAGVTIDLSALLATYDDYRLVYRTIKAEVSMSDNECVLFSKMYEIDDIKKQIVDLEYQKNDFTWRNKSALDPDTAGVVYDAQGLVSNSYDSASSLYVTNGTIEIFAYSAGVYQGIWNGSSAAKSHYFFNSGIRIDLSAMLAEYDDYRLVYRTPKEEVALSDNECVLVERKTTSDIQTEVDSINAVIGKLSVKHDLTNMAWCDRNDPIMMRINNIRDQLYIGYVDNEGNQGIVSYNLETNAIERYILQTMNADNHNGVAVGKTSDGKILCFCTGHSETNSITVYVSKKPEDITEFIQVASINAPSGYSKCTYNELVEINGKYYLFYRVISGSDEYWAVAKSNDGITWLSGDNHVFLYGMGLKYYCVPAMYDSRYIKIFLNSNYSQEATEIRFGYIDTQNGNILNADKATVLGTLGNEPLPYTSFDVVIDKGTSNLQILKPFSGNENAILYAEYPSASSSNTSNYVAKQNGNGTWDKYILPSPGEAFANGAPNGAAFVDINTYVECRRTANNYTIDLCVLSNGTVSSVKELASSPRQSIPFIIPFSTGQYVVAQRGEYTNWAQFDVDAIIRNIDSV